MGIRIRIFRTLIATVLVLLFTVSIKNVFAQIVPVDPGVRGGQAGAGIPLPGLTAVQNNFFKYGLVVFTKVDSVSGTVHGTDAGLGPTFNMDSCGGCHAQPAVGGTSPAVNPQVEVANKQGATNVVPSFIAVNGPIRAARFKFVDPPYNTIRDGGVHALFTIAGRSDAPGCFLAQPNFPAQLALNNVIFRIPTPTFGAGLIEMISDSTILANKNANFGLKAGLGIFGHENREGNSGTITRFGWKAQNKSLAIFSGEAYLVEQGVTNQLFQQERDDTAAGAANCLFNPLPESDLNLTGRVGSIPGDIESLSLFMRFLAPLARGPITTSVLNGETLFNSTGCGLCHTPQLTTGTTAVDALSNQTVNLFSDLLVHKMGKGLADDVVQGNAGPDEFRTAPLWGLGQRIFFLHDGRTNDLLDAIAQHASPGSEANSVIANFNALTNTQKQDMLNFLRSL